MDGKLLLVTNAQDLAPDEGVARKGDGEPGVKTIWLSLQRVMDVATTIQVLRNPEAMGCV
nr:hypothetical protein [Aromatoleum aromaticum]